VCYRVVISIVAIAGSVCRVDVACGAGATSRICIQEEPSPAADSGESQETLKDVVREAFRATHDGWSVDEVLIRDDVNQAFVWRCREKLPDAAEKDLNWTLLNLRKAGKLGIAATRFNDESYDGVLHLAEIVARSMQDKHKVSSDAVMADPELRREFDVLARGIDPAADAYQVRKSALRLRKARELRPELITRIADWDREVREFAAAQVAADLTLIPERPGIYLFRDKSGYLYIGEALDVRERLKSHLDESDRKSLANYLREQGVESISIEIHSFPADSRMKDVTVRRAYESELIRSREPRFNVRP
jgi:predicted GIY-YIG superfamily endonuclease